FLTLCISIGNTYYSKPLLLRQSYWAPDYNSRTQGRTDNSWGPRAIGDHEAPLSLPKLKKTYEKGTRGIPWGPLLTPGPRPVPEFPNGQSTPGG
ncbi:unnamed protein product, partial [Staurois parvus]